jgi:gliding motility-associated-like protein
MANAFIPGGSFAEFKPIFYFSESIADYEMLIFDRYGNKVYTTNNPEKGWNGNKMNQSNQPMPNGVYSYYVRIKSGNGSEQILKGSLTLIR